ncbi:MAG: phenylacetate-CoA oxygenase/reductase subunit PaaK [Dactylosporangium sp.]|nr:phenylacetate-CoA oxygenase/reductase subunit PaaK [Dactylosporangium sp.]
MVQSFPLRVGRVDHLTADAAAITFDVPADLASVFAFAPGQWLTVCRGDERRSYSICAPLGRPPRIGVREVPGGAISTWLVREVRPGDLIDVLPPAGTFTPDLREPGDHVLLAAGSGITPILSIAASVLAAHPESSVTLLYGNRRADTVMFAEEIADLKDAYPTRMRVVHVFSREQHEVELFCGRLDATKLRSMLPALVDVPAVDQWWVCGPLAMAVDAAAVLGELGVPRERVHRELFYVGEEPPPPRHREVPVVGAEVTIVLDGRTSTVTVPPGVPILDGAQRVRPDLPFACKGGVCGTCRAKLVDGQVSMKRNYALEPAELDAGYILTCQSLAATDRVTVDYDARL